MVTLYTDERMLDHAPGPRHPERPERLRMVLRQLDRVGLSARCGKGTVREATDEEILRVHTPGHLAAISRFDAKGGGLIEVDTGMSAGSQRAGRLAAGAAIDAVRGAIQGVDPLAFCAIRPPGHHARPGNPMGFCLYANAAIAAREATENLGLDRVLIVDFDVHHGNGTQEVFYGDPRVGFLSIHRYPFYPGTGASDETGTGDGLGFTRNVPLAYGTSRREYRAAFLSALDEMADRMKPQLVILSAGFDAHAEDPVGDLGLEVEDFEDLTRDVLDVAATHAGGRLVSMLEGGYNVPILAGCVAAHVEVLDSRSKAKSRGD
jgi:acetoin utilization deacetylase AcuC-like enzyme